MPLCVAPPCLAGIAGVNAWIAGVNTVDAYQPCDQDADTAGTCARITRSLLSLLSLVCLVCLL